MTNPLQRASEAYRRRSLRLSGYDYSRAGGYFVTICTQDRLCVFGFVQNGQMQLSSVGRMVEAVWASLPERYPGVVLDEYVIMPNHLHRIVVLSEDPSVNSQEFAPPRPPLGAMVRAFKAVVTLQVRRYGFSSFAWQPNYFEHVVRSEADLRRIQEYIGNNLARWSFDRDNPEGRPDIQEKSFWKGL